MRATPWHIVHHIASKGHTKVVPQEPALDKAAHPCIKEREERSLRSKEKRSEESAMPLDLPYDALVTKTELHQAKPHGSIPRKGHMTTAFE
jgi:hypothetical protein